MRSILAGKFIHDVFMIEFISEFFSQPDRIQILGVPAGIQTLFQAAQNQRRTGDAREPFTALFRKGVDLDLDAFPVSCIGGRAGGDFAVFQDYNAPAQFKVFFLASEGSDKIGSDRILQAEIVQSGVDLFKLIARGKTRDDFP